MLLRAQAIIDEVKDLIHADIPSIVLKANSNITKALAYATAYLNDEGQAWYMITFNKRAFLGKEDSEVFRKIVIHEFCHVADMVINGSMNGHSRGWSKLMRMCNQKPEALASKEDTEFLGYSTYRYFHTCNCREHGVSLKMHRDILSDKIYDCVYCNDALSKQFNFR